GLLSQDLVGFHDAHHFFVTHLAQDGGQEIHNGFALGWLQVTHAESAMFCHTHGQVGPADALGSIVEGKNHFASLSVIERVEEGLGGAYHLLRWSGGRRLHSDGIKNTRRGADKKERQSCVAEKC